MSAYGVHSYGKHITRDLSVTREGSREGEDVIDRLSWKAAAAYTHEKNYPLYGIKLHAKIGVCLLISVVT